jgi:hypothetical protein
MTGVPLNELYFEWLYSKVADPGFEEGGLTHWQLLRALFETEFVSVAGRDEDRAMDGKELRIEFVAEKNLRGVPEEWIKFGCSMLEMMVALACRLEFLADCTVHYWFWNHLVENLGLRHFTDEFELPLEDVDSATTRVIFRNYGPDGVGGFFPLRYPYRDQSELELWGQLSDYLEEIRRIG